MKKISLFILIANMLAFWSCNSKQDAPSSFTLHHYDSPADSIQMTEAINALGDSIDGEEVTSQCAMLYLRLNDAAEKLDAVNSPHVLIKAKKEYMEAIAEVNKNLPTLDDQEKTVIQKQKAEVDKKYAQACRSFEIPASGVISNLKRLNNEIEKVKTPQDLDRFQSSRIGMLRGLDDIHLCVEQNSPQISEVKRLAQSLKGKYESKKSELGIQ